jgi:transcriptional regulator with XRE-family HTH domain
MASEFGTKVAQRIRELRASRGLSIRELARRSGIAPESVSRSERAINEISLTNLEKLCAGLGVRLPEFFSFGGGGSSAKVPPEVANVVGLLVRLPAPSRRAVSRGLGLILSGGAPSRAKPTRGRTTSRR